MKKLFSLGLLLLAMGFNAAFAGAMPKPVPPPKTQFYIGGMASFTGASELPDLVFATNNNDSTNHHEHSPYGGRFVAGFLKVLDHDIIVGTEMGFTWLGSDDYSCRSATACPAAPLGKRLELKYFSYDFSALVGYQMMTRLYFLMHFGLSNVRETYETFNTVPQINQKTTINNGMFLLGMSVRYEICHSIWLTAGMNHQWGHSLRGNTALEVTEKLRSRSPYFTTAMIGVLWSIPLFN